MSSVAIVTDSTAYIPTEMMNGYSIQVVPLNVIWGDQTFLDGVDIQPNEFYDRLKGSKITPTTSQPSPEMFKNVYKGLLEHDHDVISLHISSKLSGTVDSAFQAKQQLNSNRIEVIDSQLTSMALGFPVLAVGKAAKEGATLQECKALAEQSVLHSGAIFTVSTLEYLRRGGRIGGASALLGTALDLKPILTLIDGKIEAVERVRTLNKAIDRLVDHLIQQTKKRTPLQVAAINANSPLEAERILAKIREKYDIADIDVAIKGEISPVIGTHTGPGTLGIAYMAGF